MKKQTISFVGLFIIAGLAFCFSYGEAKADDSQRVLTCLGDSVTHGYPYVGTSKTYPAKLQVHLVNQYGEDQYSVVNRGVSGHRADEVLADLQTKGWLGADNPDAVLLMVGGNDLA